MNLIYFDESGNTGNNLTEAAQPMFVLGALVVPEKKWLALEIDLQAIIEKFFPSPRPDDFEVHASEIINPKGFFRTFPVQHRLDFFAAWLKSAEKHGLKFVYRAIAKKRYAAWLQSSFGTGVSINPHVAAFPLVAQVVNELLKNTPDDPFGIFISDENKDVMHDVEKSIRVLRGGESGTLRLSQIIEKGFFIESDKSLPLQLCDLCTFAARRMEEQKVGLTVKPINQACIPWIQPLIHRGKEPFADVLDWLEKQQKKERPGGKASGTEKVRTTLVAAPNMPQANPPDKPKFG